MDSVRWSVIFMSALLAGCQLSSPAGTAPEANAAPDQAAVGGNLQSGPAAPDRQTAEAIAHGTVANPISGTLTLPLNLRSLANAAGSPPVVLHAFRVTGQVIREARVSLFWKDDQSIAFVVDRVPTGVPTVLAATIGPGLVIRALIPPTSAAFQSRGQIMNIRSELLVEHATKAGWIPPVGAGGLAEVLRQGGLKPAEASSANREASNRLRKLAALGQQPSAVADVAQSLAHLADVQGAAAAVLTAQGSGDGAALAQTSPVLAATEEAWGKLGALEEAIRALPDSPEVGAELDETGKALALASRADVPEVAPVRAEVGGYSLFFYSEVRSFYDVVQGHQKMLLEIFRTLNPSDVANTIYVTGQGIPFSEAEIAAAFEAGKGPYRTSCSQVNFLGDVSCQIVANPLDRSQEAVFSREADLFAKKIDQLRVAIERNNEEAVREVLRTYPALENFIAMIRLDGLRRWVFGGFDWFKTLERTSK